MNSSLAIVAADVPDGDLLLGEAGLEVEGVGPVEGRHRLLLGLGLGRRGRGGRGAHGAAEGGGGAGEAAGNAGDGRQGHDEMGWGEKKNYGVDSDEMRCC